MSKAAGKGASKKGAAAKKGSPFKSTGNRRPSKSAGRSGMVGRSPEDDDNEEAPRGGRFSRSAASKGAGRYVSKGAATKKGGRAGVSGWLVQGVQNGKNIAYRVPANQMELYIKYKELRPADLASILQYIERFTEIAIDEYEYLSGRKIKGEAKLRIISAHTGNTVTFRFDGGWLPKVLVRDGKIEVALSAKMGLAAFVFYALVTGVNSCLDTGTKYYDYQLKKLEYEEKAEAKAERQKKIKEKEEAAKQFVDRLLNVSPEVKNYRRVADIINYQLLIVKEYKNAYQRFRQDGNFSPEEIKYLGSVYANLFNQSLANLNDLITIITAGDLRMSDDERMKAIDEVFASIQDKLLFLRHFNTNTTILAVQRAREKKDIGTAQKIYGLTH